MQQIDYQHAVEQLGKAACLRTAMADAYHLVESIARLRAGDLTRTDEVALAVADVEVACEQLRLIVGAGLVDLHKLAALARLQGRLRSHAAHRSGDPAHEQQRSA